MEYNAANRRTKYSGQEVQYDVENTRTASISGKKRTEYVTDTSGSLSRLLLAYEADGMTTSYAYGAEGLTAQYNSGTESVV